jgi:hypothetical protein
MWNLDAESFWADEIRTARMAGLPAGELLRRVFVEREFAVPVLHLLLSRVALAIDPGEWCLRMISVVSGVAGVAAVLALGREVGGDRTGWIAAALLAVSPGHILYSREARPYALLALVVAWLAWAFVLAVRSRSRLAWLGTGGLAVLACNTSFLGLFPAAATVASGVMVLCRRRRWGALLLLLAPILAFTPVWLVVLECQKGLVLDGRIPARIFASEVMARWTPLLGPGSTSTFLAVSAVAVVGLLHALRTRPAWGVLVVSSLVLPLMAFGLLSFNHTFSPRYLFSLLPILVVLQGQGLALLGERLRPHGMRLSLAALTLLVVGLNLTGWSTAFAPWRCDWRGAARAIVERWPGEVLVLSSSASPILPRIDPSIERLGYYLGDKDGRSMPPGREIVSAGRTGPAWLGLRLAGLDTPVCAVLVHDPRLIVALPEGIGSLEFRGLTVLVDDHPTWSDPERAAWLMLAQAWAALNQEEQRWLLRRAIRVAQCSANEEAREHIGAHIQAFSQRYASRFTPEERAILDYFVDELSTTPALVRPIQALREGLDVEASGGPLPPVLRG